MTQLIMNEQKKFRIPWSWDSCLMHCKQLLTKTKLLVCHGQNDDGGKLDVINGLVKQEDIAKWQLAHELSDRADKATTAYHSD